MKNTNMELKKLRAAKEYLQECKRDKIRGITRAGTGLSHFCGADDFLISAINELWDLIVEVADRKIDESIKKESQRVIEEAKEALRICKGV